MLNPFLKPDPVRHPALIPRSLNLSKVLGRLHYKYPTVLQPVDVNNFSQAPALLPTESIQIPKTPFNRRCGVSTDFFLVFLTASQLRVVRDSHPGFMWVDLDTEYHSLDGVGFDGVSCRVLVSTTGFVADHGELFSEGFYDSLFLRWREGLGSTKDFYVKRSLRSTFVTWHLAEYQEARHNLVLKIV